MKQFVVVLNLVNPNFIGHWLFEEVPNLNYKIAILSLATVKVKERLG
jgi:hypothetical protein